MNKIIQAITDTVRSTLGHPVHVERFLASRPDFRVPAVRSSNSIDFDSVPKWETFGETGGGTGPAKARQAILMGWRLQNGRYSDYRVAGPALNNLVKKVVVDDWKCDLQDLHGFSNSKSDLRTFVSTDDMVVANSQEMIEDVSLAGLQTNLAHDQISVTGWRAGSDWLHVHQWDGRMYLVNDGGSHHLAAAKYIAARIQAPVELMAPLHYHSIDPDAVAALRAEYDIYVVSHEAEVSNIFFSAMEDDGATWFWRDLPEPYWGERAIFLPRAEPTSLKVSQAFQAAGFEELGAHLEEIANRDVPEVISKYLAPSHGEADVDAEEEHEAPRG
ncbi:DUF6685 family protein [Massilia jejuensis]|uniref:DUF6685 family protein n=1 Tax=Massilia jejuensis TaxID=648894 RepID=A0ABW0PHQ7_9BURK